MCMIYHFNPETARQLAPLLQRQQLNIGSIRFIKKNKELQLMVFRREEPNADHYQIHFYNVKDWRAGWPADSETDTVLDLQTGPEGTFSVAGHTGRLDLKMDPVKISAVGQAAKK